MNDEDKTLESLIAFLGSYSLLLEQHLVGVRVLMSGAVEQVMAGISQISELTEAARKSVEAELESVYLNPDGETQALLQSVQDAAAQVIAGGAAASVVAAGTKMPNNNQTSGRFGKKIDSLQTLDDKVSELLLTIIGSVSADDVIAQRIEHICNSLNAMQIGLANMLLDFENKLNISEISKFKTDLKRYTRLQYTMEEEHQEFLSVFAEDKALVR